MTMKLNERMRSALDILLVLAVLFMTFTIKSQIIQFEGVDTRNNFRCCAPRVETGLRLIAANLDFDHESLLPLVDQARSQVEQLLRQIPAR